MEENKDLIIVFLISNFNLIVFIYWMVLILIVKFSFSKLLKHYLNQLNIIQIYRPITLGIKTINQIHI